ncbi:MAG: tetratricopeptide repeat protein [Thermoplasmatota archaeon]
MARKPKKKNALGKGLNALINGQNNGRGPSPDSDRVKNMDFYRSLLRQYVQTGERDMLIEQLLNDIRAHLGISDEEHLHLLKTLRKREEHRSSTDEEKKMVKTEIKEELTQLFSEIKGEKKVEKSEKKRTNKETIPLPDRTPDLLDDTNGEKRTIEVPPADDHNTDVHRNRKDLKKNRSLKKPGLISHKNRKLKLEWDEEEPEPMEVEPPAKRTGDYDDPIQLKSARKGLREEKKPIEAEPSSMGKEEDVPMGVMLDYKEDENIHTPSTPAPEEEIGQDKEFPKGPKRKEPKEEAPIKLKDSIVSVRILVEDGQLEDAFEMVKRLLDKDPDDPDVLNECGVILYNLGDLDGSLECYRKAMTIRTPTPEMQINYSLLLSEKGELDEALDLISEVLESDPYSEDAWNNKAVILFKAGRSREALEALDNSLRINDSSVETWLNTAIILERMEELGPAMECYKNILELDPENVTAMKGVEYCRAELGQ